MFSHSPISNLADVSICRCSLIPRSISTRRYLLRGQGPYWNVTVVMRSCHLSPSNYCADYAPVRNPMSSIIVYARIQLYTNQIRPGAGAARKVIHRICTGKSELAQSGTGRAVCVHVHAQLYVHWYTGTLVHCSTMRECYLGYLARYRTAARYLVAWQSIAHSKHGRTSTRTIPIPCMRFRTRLFQSLPRRPGLRWNWHAIAHSCAVAPSRSWIGHCAALTGI